MVRIYKRKTEDKYDQDTLRMAISEFRENKTSFNSVAKKYGVPKATLHFWLHQDFPTPGLENKGSFKRIFSPDLEAQLRECAVTLQKMCYGVTGMNMKKLAFDFAEANHLRHPFNQQKKKGWYLL
jgi:transposase-like protein